MPRVDRRTLVVAAFALVLLGGAAVWALNSDSATERQESVTERGEDVMGFDLDATVHIFTPTDTGGIEEVIARDPRDQNEIADIRTHLEGEVERWSRGDFSSPADIHGEDMPGLRELEAAGDALTMDHTTLPDGARVTFFSNDSDIVDALHDWFEAQLSDHGDDAEHG
ncbi:MAG: hypothetical protein ACR2JG_09995 [Geodermatophilaceae bacterium]